MSLSDEQLTLLLGEHDVEMMLDRARVTESVPVTCPKCAHDHRVPVGMLSEEKVRAGARKLLQGDRSPPSPRI